MKLPLKPILIAILTAGALFWVVSAYRDRREAEGLAGYYKQLNDSTLAEVAAWKAKAHSLEALKDAANEVKGTLVAGVEIRTKVDTITVRVREAPTEHVGTTRTASVTDTTDMGIRVKIDAEAPPEPANLKIGYEVIVPSFNPQVGFVKQGESYVAVVSWAGQNFTIENAFHVPEKQEPRFSLVAGASEYATIDGTLLAPEAYAGITLRVSKKDKVGLIGTIGWQEKGRVGVRWERALFSK